MLISNKIQYISLGVLVLCGKANISDLVFKASSFTIDNAQKLGYQPSLEESLSETEIQLRDAQQSTLQQVVTSAHPKMLRLLRKRSGAKKYKY